jgi:toxin-antitoxin system PIN domain toxin
VLVLDVNVLLAAHRDDHPDYAVSRPWLAELGRSRRQFAVPWVVWWSFLRLATNRRIFEVPTPLVDAMDFVHAVRLQPGYVQLEVGSRHLDLLHKLCTDADAHGDLIPDAVLAAIATEHGGAVVSFDRDFARFPALRWEVPV